MRSDEIARMQYKFDKACRQIYYELVAARDSYGQISFQYFSPDKIKEIERLVTRAYKKQPELIHVSEADEYSHEEMPE